MNQYWILVQWKKTENNIHRRERERERERGERERERESLPHYFVTKYGFSGGNMLLIMLGGILSNCKDWQIRHS